MSERAPSVDDFTTEARRTLELRFLCDISCGARSFMKGRKAQPFRENQTKNSFVFSVPLG